MNLSFFQYTLPRDHVAFTDYSPGSTNNDSTVYESQILNFGERDSNYVWDVLVDINLFFYSTSPSFFYSLSQNSNSFANTLLWMVGINTSTYIAGAQAEVITSFPGADNNLIVGNGGPIVSFVLNLTSSDDLIRTGDGNDSIYGLGGNDSITGGDGADDLFGGAGDDFLDGAGLYAVWSGENALFGGSGDGELLFYAEGGVIDLIDGGSGRDVARFVPRPSFDTATPLTINMRDLGIEVLLTGHGLDEVTVASDTIRLVSTSAGGDTILLTSSSGGPAVIWGGAGADSIRITQGSNDPNPVGILVVNVEGLTEQNFHLFDLEALGLGNGFDWTKIDAVILNPDSSDQYFINDVRIGVGTYTPLGIGDIEYAPAHLTGTTNGEAGGWGISCETVDFLGSYDGAVFAPWLEILGEGHILQTDSSGEQFLDVEWYRNENGDWISSLTGDPLDLAEVFSRISAETYFGMQGVFDPEDEFLWWYYRMEAVNQTTFLDNRGWFVVGGSFTGQLITGNGTISVTMPDPEDTSSGSGGGSAGGGPLGGAYAGGSRGANLGSGQGDFRLSGFNASQQSLVVNGQALSAVTLAAGMTATETNGSTVIRYGEDDFVVLRGVSLAEWQAGSAGQILGGAGADIMAGTSASDVIAGGGGNDTVTAGAGNDRINYTSGNDVIMGGEGNTGNDTLDLSRFDAADVTFSISGHDIFVTTPDGTIRLHYQIRYDLGHARSNIETVFLADGALDEAGIRTRAIDDQSTAGNDSISGTAFNDAFLDSAGNDTITAGDGNDTITYASGNDVILGGASNTGQDILDLSQYAAENVTFSISGHDILVATPDGTIRLHYQVRNDIGHAWSNIETLLLADGSLTEAGIRARAVDDQSTSGNDSIIGSAFNDVIDGGNGNDTLRGNAGADDFVFASGDDQDRIVDFALAGDQLRFEGLTMANLAITQVGSNTVITYGAGDTVTLVNILTSNLQAQHYDFV